MSMEVQMLHQHLKTWLFIAVINLYAIFLHTDIGPENNYVPAIYLGPFHVNGSSNATPAPEDMVIYCCD